MLEVSHEEVQEFFSPKDFQIGETIKLLGRRFLLYDCDGFTKDYYQKNHADMNMTAIEVPKKTEVIQEKKRVRMSCVISAFYFIFLFFLFFNRPCPCCVYCQEVPPYNGFGSLEDSLQNCLHLIPEPPKKNLLKMLENDNKVLRYSAKLVRHLRMCVLQSRYG